MFMKSYTAIIQKNEEIRAVDVMIEPGCENENVLSASYPDYTLVALVPGQHAKWSRVFAKSANENAQRKIYSASGSSKLIDVWDTDSLLND